MPTFARDGLTFDVKESGPADGETVVLLHGFPQHSDSWDRVVPQLNEAGYRTLAIDQRGYSPRARPTRRRDYAMGQLADDVAAAVDQLAGGRAHVVGHDWGSAAAWAFAAAHPSKIKSLTAVSVPHPMGFMRAMLSSTQGLHSWYMLFFQLPWLPERIAWRFFVLLLERWGGATAEAARRDAAKFSGPEGIRTAMNWYRGLPFGDPRETRKKVAAATLMVWSDQDRFVTRRAVDLCPRYVTGPYTLEVLRGVNHWIADQAPERLLPPLLAHLNSTS